MSSSSCASSIPAILLHRRRDIAAVEAVEILDSRGDPTLRVAVTLGDGTRGIADVPAGASTGRGEARELRDADARYGGRGVSAAVEVFRALRSVLAEDGHATGVGDEGGFAPELDSAEAACELILAAIGRAGLRPGRDVSLALDPAASSFAVDGRYVLHEPGMVSRDSEEMTALYASWLNRFPIVSIEDGLGETDWAGFRDQTAALGGRVQVVGDDLYVTRAALIARGAAERASNAVLIKLNQVGTVTETFAAIEAARAAGWRCVVSHRSGETDDAFIADFAVAAGCGQIKAGAPNRGERIAKYNRLLEIERELGDAARFEDPYRPH